MGLHAQSTDSTHPQTPAATRTQTPGTSNGQTTVHPEDEADLYTTRAEKFSDSAGALIQKEYIRVGNILGCVIQVVHYTDLINGAKVSALRFSDVMGKVAILLPPTTPKPFSGAGAASRPAPTSKEACGSPT